LLRPRSIKNRQHFRNLSRKTVPLKRQIVALLAERSEAINHSDGSHPESYHRFTTQEGCCKAIPLLLSNNLALYLVRSWNKEVNRYRTLHLRHLRTNRGDVKTQNIAHFTQICKVSWVRILLWKIRAQMRKMRWVKCGINR
jgi:hypothetical protein